MIRMNKCKSNCPNRLVILSLDAVGAKDMEYMSLLPNFSKFMKSAAGCKKVQSVYPTLTYPAHTSIITGKLPNNHGIVNNTLLQPKYQFPDWNNNRKNIKGTTLYDEVIKKGWKVASLLWPVTGNSKIQFNLPEIHAARWWQNQVCKTLRSGNLSFIIELIPFLKELRQGVNEPALDNFVHKSAIHVLEKHRPNMLMVHFLDVDYHRHFYGVSHDKVKEALNRLDIKLGEILQTLQKIGDIEKTTVVVLGDHYQKDANTVVFPNYILKEKGYLTTKRNAIKNYKVVAKNCDGSCYIYLHPSLKGNQKMTEEVTKLFINLSKDKKYGIQRVYNAQEAKRKGADDNCVCMLEARDQYYFLDDFEKLTCEVKDVKHHKMFGTHGYDPTLEGYQTFFMASGCGIEPGVFVPHMTLMDEGVTLAKLLGVDLGEVDGKVITEILRTERT